MPTIVKNYKSLAPPPGHKVIDSDVMEGDKYLFTFRYAYLPIFKFDLNEMAKELLKLRPSLKDKKIELWINYES